MSKYRKVYIKVIDYMVLKEQLIQKNGLVAIELSRELATMQVGDRIDTIAEYSEKFKTARGTVQSAIKLLEQDKAISLERRGHLGTFIKFIDYKILWRFTDFGTIIGVMPLPYSKLYEGLATGLYKTLNESNIPLNLAYMRGSQARLNALKTGRYDFAVVSKLAAIHVMKNDIDIAIEFGKYTYVNEHAMMFSDLSKKEIENKMKVGIDRSSIDHCLLTLSQCNGKDVQLIDLAYNQIILKLSIGEIDAAIWNIDEIIERKLNTKYYPLTYKNMNDDGTEAVIVVKKFNYSIKNLLMRYINKEEVIECQKLVVKEMIIPSY